tara:strand:- start:1663 stop:2307 length:645 start_codon:yes stop_codon:yes gene_type:complete
MTAAQKAAKANFKKAIEYRKKTGVSLKEAFAHVYGKKVGAAPKKKAAAKKAAKKVVKKAAPKKAAKKKHTKYGVVKKHVRRVAGLHKDTKSHNVNIRVVSGVGKSIKIGSMPIYKDKDAAREIQLYADNDSQLYYQRRNPILKNLSKKYLKGQYDIEKAAKLWRYYIDAALQKYHKEFGGRGSWSNMLSVPDRNLLATEYAKRTKEEFDLGNTY